jgi:DNA gyrase/topoisomerase IV subunit B
MTSSKIDQKNVRHYVAFARANFSDAEMTDYEQQGRAAIIQSIPDLGIIDIAKENAARVLVPMLTQLGYREENITIAFRKEFNQNNIMRLLEQ